MGRPRQQVLGAQQRQPVGHQPGSDDQHPLVAQGAQAVPEGEQRTGVLRWDRQLVHRSAGIGPSSGVQVGWRRPERPPP